MVEKLHGILKPFLLRRLKGDVETNLPRKKEILLYAQMAGRHSSKLSRVHQTAVANSLIIDGRIAILCHCINLTMNLLESSDSTSVDPHLVYPKTVKLPHSLTHSPTHHSLSQ